MDVVMLDDGYIWLFGETTRRGVGKYLQISLAGCAKDNIFGDVVIPSKHNDRFGSMIKTQEPVTVIAKSAFECCDRIISIHIPETVKTIEAKAFKGCKDLQNINIPSGVEDFNAVVLLGWQNLERIVIVLPTYFEDANEIIRQIKQVATANIVYED